MTPLAASKKMLRRFETLLNKPGRRLSSEQPNGWRTAMKQGMTLRPLSDYQGQPVYKVVYIAPDEASLAEARRQYEHQFFFCESRMELTSSVMNNGERSTAGSAKGRASGPSAGIWSVRCRIPSALATATTTWLWPMWWASASAWPTAPKA